MCPTASCSSFWRPIDQASKLPVQAQSAKPSTASFQTSIQQRRIPCSTGSNPSGTGSDPNSPSSSPSPPNPSPRRSSTSSTVKAAAQNGLKGNEAFDAAFEALTVKLRSEGRELADNVKDTLIQNAYCVLKNATEA